MVRKHLATEAYITTQLVVGSHYCYLCYLIS